MKQQIVDLSEMRNGDVVDRYLIMKCEEEFKDSVGGMDGNDEIKGQIKG